MPVADTDRSTRSVRNSLALSRLRMICGIFGNRIMDDTGIVDHRSSDVPFKYISAWQRWQKPPAAAGRASKSHTFITCLYYKTFISYCIVFQQPWTKDCCCFLFRLQWLVNRKCHIPPKFTCWTKLCSHPVTPTWMQLVKQRQPRATGFYTVIWLWVLYVNAI